MAAGQEEKALPGPGPDTVYASDSPVPGEAKGQKAKAESRSFPTSVAP